MACRGCLECLLSLLNLLMMWSGLAIVGYGIYLLVEWGGAASAGDGGGATPPASGSAEVLALGRRMMLVSSIVAEGILDKLSSAWFIYLFMGVGAVLFIISCVGCIGATTTNGCCLSFYSFLLVLLILMELGCAAFIFFVHDLTELILADKTGNFSKIYDFLKGNWKIAKWIMLGLFILQALLFLLTLMVKAANNRSADYDSDEEYIAPRRHTIRQPLVDRQGVMATGVPVAGMLDRRPSRNDAWSKRMREKYGLDTSEFSYDSSDPNKLKKANAPPPEYKGCCTIM